MKLNARLHAALKECAAHPARPYLRRHASMKKLVELGYASEWYFGETLHSYDITAAGRAKLKEMEG
jgi:hypothetical protein